MLVITAVVFQILRMLEVFQNKRLGSVKMVARGGSRVDFPTAPVKHLADLRNRANSQQYSSIYEDWRPKIEDIERSDGKKRA